MVESRGVFQLFCDDDDPVQPETALEYPRGQDQVRSTRHGNLSIARGITLSTALVIHTGPEEGILMSINGSRCLFHSATLMDILLRYPQLKPFFIPSWLDFYSCYYSYCSLGSSAYLLLHHHRHHAHF